MKRLTWVCAWFVLGCGGDDDGGSGKTVRDGGAPAEDGGKIGRDDGGAPTRDDAGTASRGPTTSGVDGKLVISALSEAQRKSVCVAEIEWWYAQDTVEAECTEIAVFDTEDIKSCTETRDLCVTEARARGERDRLQALEECETENALDCEYTVAEYERCYKERLTGQVRAAREFACTDAGDVSESEEPEDDANTSEECQEILASCYTS